MKKIILLIGLFGAGALHAGDFDVPALSRDADFKRTLELNQREWRFTESFLNNGDPKQIAQAVLANSDGLIRAITPWLFQDLTRQNLPRAAIMIQAYLAQSLVTKHYPGVLLEDFLKGAAAKPAKYSPEALQQVEKLISTILSRPPFARMAELKLSADIFCGPFHDGPCGNALRDLIDFVNPRSYMAVISITPVWKEILSNPAYVQGSAHFALKIMSQIRERRRSQLHLFDDLTASFIAVGNSPSAAREYAFNLLGIYGSRGCSLAIMDGFPNKENLPVFVSLEIFTAALGLLDQQTLSTGSVYSYPSNVRALGPNGGPYHFWYSAFLAKYLTTKGYTPRSALLATHLLAKMYDFGATVYGREENRPYTDKFFNIYNIGIQKDIAYGNAGSLWATGTSQIIDVDKIMLKMFQAAQPMPPLTPQELEAGLKNTMTKYGWFNRVLAVDKGTALLYVEDRVKK